MMLEVDLHTKIIASDQRIWAVHPGRNKIFLKIFFENECIFLDLPKMSIISDDLNDNTVVAQKIRMALAIKSHLLRVDEAASPEHPSMDFNEYSKEDVDRFISSQITNVKYLFGEVKKGDTVIVPGQGGLFGTVLIGEISSDFNAVKTVFGRDGIDYPVQFRSVKWIETSLKRKDLTEDLAKRLQNPHTIISIDRRRFGKEIYSYCYKNFSSSEISKTEISGPDYLSKNAMDILPAAIFISYLVAFYNASINHKNEDISDLSIEQVTERFYDPSLVDDLKIQFSSPGKFILYTKVVGLSMFLGGAIAAFSLPIQVLPSNADEIHTKNYGIDVSTPAENESDQVLKNLILSMTPKRKGEVHKRVQEAKGKIGIKTDVTAEIKVNIITNGSQK